MLITSLGLFCPRFRLRRDLRFRDRIPLTNTDERTEMTESHEFERKPFRMMHPNNRFEFVMPTGSSALRYQISGSDFTDEH